MHTISTRPRRLAAAMAAALLLMACAGDEEGPDAAADDAAADAQELADDAEQLADDAEQIAEDATEQLEDAGVDTDAQDAYADLTFQGETLRIPADESFGCFLTEDGGSQGAIDFSGTDDAGTELEVSWAGDTPEASSRISIVFADGGEWITPAGGAVLDVTLDGSTAAQVSGTVLDLGGGTGDEAEVTVDIVCP